MRPKYFKSRAVFREWLQDHHDTAIELLVGFRKRASGKPSMTWSESVDQALCFGWIDGVRRSIDESSYCIRFTPRKPRSIWSRVNIARFRKLEAEGLVAPMGAKAFEQGHELTAHYSYENAPRELTGPDLVRFKANARAWAYFQSSAPSYRKVVLWWVLSAKRPETRERRLATLIADSAAGRKIRAVDIGQKKASPDAR
jgi:uncharacterized protein YdeI (YjbR/CyaY-like superfamily)